MLDNGTAQAARLPTEGDNLVVRLNTTIRVRWLAVIGQTIAVLLISLVMDFDMLLMPCLLLIALSAWLNIFLRFRYPGNERWRGFALTGLLAYDTIQLASLLYLTGGIQNPFAILLAVPVIISAATQRMRFTVPLFLLALGAATLLVFFHQPLPWFDPAGLELPIEMKTGIWVALASTMAFTAVYTFRVADESRKLADALAATQLVLEREQHVTNLDGLAAAAAHELGTPLATIALVAKEMQREAGTGPANEDDLALLVSQAERCRQILRTISTLSSERDETIAAMPVPVLMQEVAEPYRHTGKELHISQKGEPPVPVAQRNASVIYGLGNLLENAIDFANTTAWFEADWDETDIRFRFLDDGPGFSPNILERIGEPYLSRRGGRTAETAGCLGLGLFIAKTLLERNGAGLVFENRSGTTGASVTVSWKRADFERRPVQTVLESPEPVAESGAKLTFWL